MWNSLSSVLSFILSTGSSASPPVGDLQAFKWWLPTPSSGRCATIQRNTKSLPVALTERCVLGILTVLFIMYTFKWVKSLFSLYSGLQSLPVKLNLKLFWLFYAVVCKRRLGKNSLAFICHASGKKKNLMIENPSGCKVTGTQQTQSRCLIMLLLLL